MKYKLEGISTGGHCEHLWLTLPEYGVGVLMNNDYTKEPEEGENFDVGIYELEGEDGMGEHFEGCFDTLQNFRKSDIVARMVGYVEGHGFKRIPPKENLGNNFRKIFKAVWGEGYVQQGEALLTFDDITEENGWFDWCIEQLEDAEIGQTVDCSCISGVLHVTRVQ